MNKYYVSLATISVLVIGAVIWALTILGTPAMQRDLRFDRDRIQRISNLSAEIERYYSEKATLPEDLSSLAERYRYLEIKDPETKKEYEYLGISQTSYKICATFATDSSQDKSRPSYYTEEFNHPKGYFCFSLRIGGSFSDERIEDVTTNAKQIRFSRFPHGFFNEGPNDWGLINYENKAVEVTVTFKEPVKIESISNIFTHCPVVNCYSWSAEGVTEGNASVKLVDRTFADPDVESTKKLVADEEISSVKITTERLGGSDRYVHWKKIRFGYR